MGKYYAVKNGRMPGIYTTWEECKIQIDKYSGAEYKSFKSLIDAKEYLGENNIIVESIENIIPTSNIVDIYVDGSYKNGVYSYGMVIVSNKLIIEQIHGYGDDNNMSKMQNVAGEITAAVEAVEWCIKNNKRAHIFHDYLGIEKWVTGEWRCKNTYTSTYKDYMRKNKEYIDGFTHIKAHSNNEYNELADSLAGSIFDLIEKEF